MICQSQLYTLFLSILYIEHFPPQKKNYHFYQHSKESSIYSYLYAAILYTITFIYYYICHFIFYIQLLYLFQEDYVRFNEGDIL
jgi:hypothetical protein